MNTFGLRAGTETTYLTTASEIELELPSFSMESRIKTARIEAEITQPSLEVHLKTLNTEVEAHEFDL